MSLPTPTPVAPSAGLYTETVGAVVSMGVTGVGVGVGVGVVSALLAVNIKT